MTHYFVLRCFLFLLLGYLGMPFYKLQRAKEGAWKAEDLNQTLNQVQLNEPPPTNYMIPEPMFPDLDSSQVGSYSSTQVLWKASHLICASSCNTLLSWQSLPSSACGTFHVAHTPQQSSNHLISRVLLTIEEMCYLLILLCTCSFCFQQ